MACSGEPVAVIELPASMSTRTGEAPPALSPPAAAVELLASPSDMRGEVEPMLPVTRTSASNLLVLPGDEGTEQRAPWTDHPDAPVAVAVPATGYADASGEDSDLADADTVVDLDAAPLDWNGLQRYMQLHALKAPPGRAGALMKFQGKIGAISPTFLIDSGSSGNFVSEAFVRQHQLRLEDLPRDQQVDVSLADGTPYTVERVLPASRVAIQGYHDRIDLNVLSNLTFDVVLGTPWLQAINPSIDWQRNQLTLRDAGGKQVLLEPGFKPSSLSYLMGISAVDRALRTSQVEEMFLVVITPTVTNAAPAGKQQMTAGAAPAPRASTALSPAEEMREKLRADYPDVFAEPSGMPPQRSRDFTIKLAPGSSPPFRTPYKMSPKEEAEAHRQIADLLDRGLIDPSTSEFGAPVLFVKKDGSMPMCVDYRALNKLTVRDRYPLPHIEVLLNKLHGAKYFTKLDLASGYHQIRIAPEDIPKTAFTTPLGHFEFKVLPFGLTNAPATFQSIMNDIFRSHLGSCVLVYLDDILIFSKTKEEHVRHMDMAFQLLQQHQLHIQPAKCEFFASEVEFLGHTISARGIQPLHAKVTAVNDWPTPRNQKELRSFLGLANFYRRFIASFASIASPLTALTSKEAVYVWGPEQQHAFEALKHALTSAPVLQVPNPAQPYSVFTDASDFGIGATLMQEDPDGHLHPVSFDSHRLTSAERNYSTTDREGLAIVSTLKKWRHILHGVPTTVYSDHAPLQFLQRQQNLNSRQARWVDVLAEFGDDLTIKYLKGKENVVADALSRRPDHQEMVVTASTGDTPHAVPMPMVLSAITAATVHPDILSDLMAAYQTDEYAQLTFKDIQAGEPGPFELHRGVLFYTAGDARRIYVPAQSGLRERLMWEHHDNPLSGHLGRDKTIEHLSRRFYWPGMAEEVAAYVRTCLTCQLCKPSTRKPFGEFMPLPAAESNWSQVTMDLIVGLPETNRGTAAVVTFVDRLSKMVHWVPTRADIDAPQLAALFMEKVFKHHGLPAVLISDRDPKFISAF